VQKTAEPIHLPFRLWTRVGRRIHNFNRIRKMAPMCRCGDTLPPVGECDWTIRLRRWCALPQITLTICYL